MHQFDLGLVSQNFFLWIQFLSRHHQMLLLLSQCWVHNRGAAHELHIVVCRPQPNFSLSLHLLLLFRVFQSYNCCPSMSGNIPPRIGTYVFTFMCECECECMGVCMCVGVGWGGWWMWMWVYGGGGVVVGRRRKANSAEENCHWVRTPSNPWRPQIK